ncbi:MAG TPA: hypothetical protein VF602_00760 [Pedobacter sp.]|jgi:hypothetical protein
MKTFFKHLLAWLIPLFLLIGFSNSAMAQDSTKDSLKFIIRALDSFSERQSLEKLYLHTDKPHYSTGDTFWFKAYLLEASYLKPSEKSGLLYIEIANDSNIVVKRTVTPISRGRSAGQITLNELEMPVGGYVLRAYTTWMRNYGDTNVFEKPFYIGNAKANDWLVNYTAQVLKKEGKDNMQLEIKLRQVDKSAVDLRELQIRLADDKRTWNRSNVETSTDGLLNLNVDLPEQLNTKRLNLFIRDLRKSAPKRTVLVPLSVNQPDRIDLQFMPEGGDLVAGLPSRVAFKALNEDGTSAEVSGKIISSKLLEICPFNSSHKGMGSFNFRPEPGESYFAKMNLPGGKQKTYSLPLVKTAGISLKVDNPFGSDSCEVTVRATPDVVANGRTFFLIGQARGVTCFGSSFILRQSVLKFKVPNSLFPTGIARFILTGPDKIALSERIVFIEHADDLRISTILTKPSYSLRDSVLLQIRVSDKEGNPVHGSFSVAITDDNQVKRDSLSDYTILNQILLASDLKGTIEEPGHYLSSARTPKIWSDLDHLLLTQGWSGFDWGENFKPSKNPQYAAEPTYLVKGKVTNAFNKPVPATRVNLLSHKPSFVRDTLTNAQGEFYFDKLFPIDTAEFFIQTRNKKGKSFNVNIEVEKFVPPFFSASAHRLKPWYVNIDTSGLNQVDKKIALRKGSDKVTGNYLKEVVITGKKIIKGSKNLNGPGEADFTITTEELQKAGRTTLLDLLEKRVKGFRLKALKSGGFRYVIKDQSVHLIIDGIDALKWGGGRELEQFLKSYDAEEIAGIELMTNRSVRYTMRFLEPSADPAYHAFIEVTTYSGFGPFLKKAVGTYVHRPLPFSMPKKFYSPKYKAESVPDMTDIRSTISGSPT